MEDIQEKQIQNLRNLHKSKLPTLEELNLVEAEAGIVEDSAEQQELAKKIKEIFDRLKEEEIMIKESIKESIDAHDFTLDQCTIGHDDHNLPEQQAEQVRQEEERIDSELRAYAQKLLDEKNSVEQGKEEGIDSSQKVSDICNLLQEKRNLKLDEFDQKISEGATFDDNSYKQFLIDFNYDTKGLNVADQRRIENYHRLMDDDIREYIQKRLAELKEEKKTNEEQENKTQEQVNTNQKQEAEISPEEDVLRRDVKNARELYAAIEYKDRTAMMQVLKFFSKNDNQSLDTQSIVDTRNAYNEAVKKLKDYKVDKLKNGNYSKEELQTQIKNILMEFNYKEVCELYDARTRAKINHLNDTENKGPGKKVWDKVLVQSTKIADWYNHLSTETKVAAGLIAFATSGSALWASKRAFGAFVMAASMNGDTAFRWLEKRNEHNRAKRDIAKHFDEEKEDVDFEKLKSFLDSDINKIDTKLNRNVFKSYIGKGLVFAGAAILSHDALTAASDAIHHGNIADASSFVGKIAHFLSGSHEEVAQHAHKIVPKTASATQSSQMGAVKPGLKPAPFDPRGTVFDNHGTSTHNISSHGNVPAGHEPVAKVPGGKVVTGAPAAAAIENHNAAKEVASAAHEKMKTIPMSIKEPISNGHGHFHHDSIWGATKRAMEQVYNGSDSATINRHTVKVFNAGIANYAAEHHISTSEAMARLSKIHPGTQIEITFDPKGEPHLHIVKVHFMENHHGHGVHHGHGTGHHEAGKHGIEKQGEVPVAEGQDTFQDNTDEAAKVKQMIDADNHKIGSLKEKHNIASAIASGEAPVLDPNSPNYAENFRYAENLKNAAAHNYPWAPSYEAGRIGDLIKGAEKHMTALTKLSQSEAFKDIRKTFFDSDISKMHKFENLKVTDALNNPEKLNGLSDKAFEKIVGFANNDLTKPLPGETFKNWTRRITLISRAIIESRLKQAA